MTIESAEAEYTRLLNQKSTEEELWAGWRKLVEGTDKMNIVHYNLCNNDEQEGGLFP